MTNIQKIKFNSVGEFLDFIPDEELIIVKTLREIILDSISPLKEKLAYNVPFYYGNSRICFIWPTSIPWGGVDEEVVVGFCRGHLLSDEIGYLERGNRTEVFTKTFTSLDESDIDLLHSYLFEAKEIDKNSAKK